MTLKTRFRGCKKKDREIRKTLYYTFKVVELIPITVLGSKTKLFRAQNVGVDDRHIGDFTDYMRIQEIQVRIQEIEYEI